MTTRSTTDRRYRVYAHGCYVQGLASIDQKVLDMGNPYGLTGILYKGGLSDYPHLKRISVIPERKVSRPPVVGPLTIKRTDTAIYEVPTWRIYERTENAIWEPKSGIYIRFENVLKVLRDITSLRESRLHALGNIFPPSNFSRVTTNELHA